MTNLFDYATKLCLLTYPRIQLEFGLDLSVVSPDVKKQAKQMVYQALTDSKYRAGFVQEVDNKFKGQQY